MMTSLMSYSCPFYQAMQEGVQEIIGPEGMHAVVDAQKHISAAARAAAETPAAEDEMAVFFASLERVFGRLAGQGIAQRGGRNSFMYLSRQPELHAAFSDMVKRLLPVSARIKQGLELLSGLVAGQCGMVIAVDEDDQNWYWRIQSCRLCSGRQGEAPACYFLVGLIQEFTAWMSGGRFFEVTGNACCAAEDKGCLLQIHKKPME